ncbi:hypothetical protein Mmc1_2683 [Magnetococcus marinus MC-1]|uniref:DUF4197 domain-containing protein n=1 Tax=Magnetococcus marinus (strain ATCC BAA-1437 / JCM 17883 / MC-1) TaxID=156889 RepID=A0LB36_MAGMM|nr:DUF4197 domain-containing protein [Magnetococcus marinus]ABK45179.1 hypothetical protein Mmc1_2683 [Magnetococcus marinus MC-1]
MHKHLSLLASAALLTLLPIQADAGWMDLLNQVAPLAQQATQPATQPTTATPATGSAFMNLSQQEMVDGLKEALRLGAKTAVSNLGKQGGFLDDASVKIPMPEALGAISSLVGPSLQDKFITTMNRAAEQAVPSTVDIFIQAINNMTLTDALAILQGGENAATDYFRRSSSTALQQAILPIVTQATGESGATATYKQVSGLLQGAGGVSSLLGSAGQHSGGGLGSLLGSVTSMISPQDFDLDKYVTQKSVDGLFSKMAIEEQKIRTNPVARSTDLLKKVFDFGNTL